MTAGSGQPKTAPAIPSSKVAPLDSHPVTTETEDSNSGEAGALRNQGDVPASRLSA